MISLKNKPFYILTVGDIQNVATEEIGRLLTTEEIKLIEARVPDRIDWYTIIADAIGENIKPEKEEATGQPSF